MQAIHKPRIFLLAIVLFLFDFLFMLTNLFPFYVFRPLLPCQFKYNSLLTSDPHSFKYKCHLPLRDTSVLESLFRNSIAILQRFNPFLPMMIVPFDLPTWFLFVLQTVLLLTTVPTQS